jgi:cytochrome c biogenesis protein CcdA
MKREYFFSGGSDAPELSVYLFSRRCPYCDKLLNDVLPEAAEKNGVSLRVAYYDLDVRGVYDLLTVIESDFGKQGVAVPAIFMGSTVLAGEKGVDAGLEKELATFKASSAVYKKEMIHPFEEAVDVKELQETTFRELTLGVIIGGGLLDGVNPCAFTTIIFLISYLALVGASRKQTIIIGSLFTLAVFLTYLGIGIMLFKIAFWISSAKLLSFIIDILLIVIVSFLAVFIFIDLLKFLEGKEKDITLQLPDFIKKRIRGRIRNFANYSIGISSAAFVLGVVIAGMELACTGQVYFPIVTMIADPMLRGTALLYLVLYNLAFILPLVVVFGIAAAGITSEQLANFFKKPVVLVKLGMTVLFVLMAILIVVYKL